VSNSFLISASHRTKLSRVALLSLRGLSCASAAPCSNVHLLSPVRHLASVFWLSSYTRILARGVARTTVHLYKVVVYIEDLILNTDGYLDTG
jgi:hypothetical protein